MCVICLQVSAWLCTVMAAAFFTANLATEELQGSLYVNFILTSMGECLLHRAPYVSHTHTLYGVTHTHTLCVHRHNWLLAAYQLWNGSVPSRGRLPSRCML